MNDEELAKKERERKKAQAHLESRQNLDVLFYDQVCCLVSYPLKVDSSVLQDGQDGEHYALQGSVDMPAYPYINFEPHLPRFGHNITAFQHHVFPQLVWTSVARLNHVFNVEKVKTIILRRKGVTDMPGLDEEVNRVQKPLAAPHYRNNLVAEKRAVRNELSRRKSLLKVPSVSNPKVDRRLTDSDGFSDVEIVHPTSSASTASSGPPHQNQGRRESTEATRYSKHARRSTGQRFAAHASSPPPSSPVSVSEISCRQRSNSPSPLLVASSSSSSSPVVMHLPLLARSRSVSLEQPSTRTRTTSSSSSQHPDAHAAKKRPKKVYWHTDLHCLEVAAGIAKMASHEVKGLNKAERFTFAFGSDRKYSERTFQDAETQWRLASHKDREDAIQLGLTPAGLWKVFSRKHPVKSRKAVKNAKAAAVDSDSEGFR